MGRDKPNKLWLVASWAGAAVLQCALFVFVLGHAVFGVPVQELWRPAWVLLALDVPLFALLEPARRRAYAADPRPGGFTALWYCWGLSFYFLLVYYGARFGVISWESGFVTFLLMVPIWGIAAIVMYRMLKNRHPAGGSGQGPAGGPNVRAVP